MCEESSLTGNDKIYKNHFSTYPTNFLYSYLQFVFFFFYVLEIEVISKFVLNCCLRIHVIMYAFQAECMFHTLIMVLLSSAALIGAWIRAKAWMDSSYFHCHLCCEISHLSLALNIYVFSHLFFVFAFCSCITKRKAMEYNVRWLTVLE